MKICKLALISLPLMMGACTDSSNQQTSSESGKESALKEQTKVWTEETKKLGETAWQSTKDAANDAAVKSKEYYESAKDATARAVDTTAQTTSEIYQSAKEKGSEVLEAGKEGAVEAYETTRETAAEAYEATKQTVTEAYDSTKQQTGELIQGAADENSTQIIEQGHETPAMPDVTGNAATQEATGAMDQATQALPKPAY